MANLIRNFQLQSGAKGEAGWKGRDDDPRNLVELAEEMGLLQNGLVGWARELERFREYAASGFVDHVVDEGGRRVQLVNAGKYLGRTVDEYAAMVMKGERMKEGVDMAVLMVFTSRETSSIARQEVSKMKALAILTMLFLPGTFVAVSFLVDRTPFEEHEPLMVRQTFMSMGLFNWHPEDGKTSSATVVIARVIFPKTSKHHIV
ncbi:hypothetical protein B0H67DRAFT_648859 [Lasiosphaeris hirsuta]|uniref:Uncharacterized protein n=1 Tax=Lasiosphaeris hirsuta TaxID=260670 RepID=A0AA40DIG6_9PEZI|nr:hypothetical protein B0H67DRAFT_648859 [Lasiosphaeris hirsuta]